VDGLRCGPRRADRATTPALAAPLQRRPAPLTLTLAGVFLYSSTKVRAICLISDMLATYSWPTGATLESWHPQIVCFSAGWSRWLAVCMVP
jgi:hypothetical protein